MNPEDMFVYLFTHFAKHFRDGGIGCRHVLDLWVYLQNNPELDWERIKREMKTLEVWTFFKHMRSLLEVWFVGGYEDALCESMGAYLFAGGSFADRESNILSITVRDAHGQNGKSVYLRRHLFPGAKELEGLYPVLKKAPWLLPGVWVVRLVRKAVAPESVVAQWKILRLLSQEKLNARQAFLASVGLEYRF
jgi:hypothetical protein